LGDDLLWFYARKDRRGHRAKLESNVKEIDGAKPGLVSWEQVKGDTKARIARHSCLPAFLIETRLLPLSLAVTSQSGGCRIASPSRSIVFNFLQSLGRSDGSKPINRSILKARVL
jgi:hypothetical protein